MRINIWNINGLRKSKVKNIANDIQFRNILQTNKIICFTETWRDFNSLLSFNFGENFKEFHYPGYRCHGGGRASGGMSLLIRKSIINYASFEDKGWVLLLGDTNARTNCVNDFIENDELDDYLPVDEQYAPDLVLEKRVNADSSPLNTNGSSMIEFCKSTGFRILNGRIDKDNSSGFTYFSFNGNSTDSETP